MRKLSLFLLLASFTLFVKGEEIVIQNFESGFSGKWGTNGNIGNTADENHENFAIVDNPNKSGINTSDKVGKFHRLQSGNWWALAWFEFNAIEITASLSQPKYLHISVYKPIASTVCVQLKDKIYEPTYNTGELKNDKQIKINEWQDLVYKITSSGTFSLMEVKPDFVNSPPLSERLTGDIDIYFDNIVINDDPTPLGEEPEPLPEFKGKLPEGFEGENTLIDPVFYGERFGSFGQTGAATDLTVAENPAKVGINTTNKVAKFVRKVDGNWWAGVYMIPLDPMVINENNKYFHIMVYRESDPTPLSLKLEKSGGNTGDIVLDGNVAGTYDWVDYVFEVPAEKYDTYDKIAFMPDFVQDPAPAERFFEDALIYFDALEINNDPNPRTSAEISGLFTPAARKLSSWYDGNGNIQIRLPQHAQNCTIELVNATGQLIKSTISKQHEHNVTISANGVRGFVLVKLTTASGEVYTSKLAL